MVASREAESLESDFAGCGNVVGAVPPGQAISVSDRFDLQVEIADQFVFGAEVLNMVITGKAVRGVARCPAPTDRALLDPPEGIQRASMTSLSSVLSRYSQTPITLV